MITTSYPSHREVEVESSNIKSVAYDEIDKVLFITFHRGGRYAYFGVPVEIYLNLLGAESKGKYFHQNIKSEFPYEKDLRA